MTDWTAEIRRRLEGLHLRPEREAEIVDELSQHLDDQVRERVAAGATPSDAQREALTDLDAPGALERRLRDTEARMPLHLPAPGAPARGAWLSALWQDTRVAVRGLRRRPWFSISVLATLALTIGPATAIVSVGNWLLWSPPKAVTDPDRLVVVWSGTWRDTGGVSPSGISYANLGDLRAGSQTMASLAGWQESGGSLAVPGARPSTTQAGFVTANFFDVLGLRLAAGRAFTIDEDLPPYGQPVTVVSYALAERVFGSPDAALDKTIHLNGRPLRIVGVAPRGFGGATPTSQVEVWYPGAAYAHVNHFGAAAADRYRGRTDGLFYMFIGRLAAGRTAAEAQAELDTLFPLMAERHPGDNEKFKTVRARVFAGLGPQELSRPTLQRQVTGLLIVAGMLLLLGCANASNLLLAEGIRAQRERAVRLALGASRARLVRQQLTEGVVLAVIGAGVGVAFAFALKQVIQFGLLPGLGQMPSPPDVPIDRTVLLLTTATAVVCGILASLAPSWLGLRVTVQRALSQSGSRSVAGAPRVRAGLSALQLALSLALVTGAALLIVSLQRLGRVDLGFTPDNVVAQWVGLRGHGYTPDRMVTYNQELVARLAANPSFELVSLATGHPFAYSRLTRVTRPGADGTAPLSVREVATDERFVTLLDLPVLHGRYFEPADILRDTRETGTSAVVSASLARAFFGREDVVGERVQLPRTALNPVLDLVVVGVMADALTHSLTAPPDHILYLPLTRADLAMQSVVLARSRVDVARVNEIVAAAAAELDATLPLGIARSLSNWIDRGVATTRMYAQMLSLLGGIAVLLAAIGLYGLLSQAVGERRREFGVRMAIGATARDIARLVFRHAAVTCALGVAAGLGLTVWGVRLLQSHLWGVSEFDPRIYAVSTLILVSVAALAALRPAWAATRVNPVETLRSE